MKRHLLTAAALALLPAAAHAQPASAPVRVNILTEVTLTPSGSTEFGTVGNSEAKPHTINPAQPDPDQSTAKFVVDGENNADVKVDFDVTVTLCHGMLGCGKSITFTSNVCSYSIDNQINCSPNFASGSTVRLNGKNWYFWLGGKIDVDAGQATGRYEGTFTMTVVYA